MANKVGPMIKEARTAAGLTQEQLAKKIEGLVAADISKAERGEKELSQAILKQIAKATGVTQTSLVEAAKSSTYGAAKSAASKTSSGKASSPKPAADKSSMQLTAAEKKLVELYRAADADTKKAALKVLKGEGTDTGELLSSLLGSAMEMFGNSKK